MPGQDALTLQKWNLQIGSTLNEDSQNHWVSHWNLSSCFFWRRSNGDFLTRLPRWNRRVNNFRPVSLYGPKSWVSLVWLFFCRYPSLWNLLYIPNLPPDSKSSSSWLVTKTQVKLIIFFVEAFKSFPCKSLCYCSSFYWIHLVYRFIKFSPVHTLDWWGRRFLSSRDKGLS